MPAAVGVGQDEDQVVGGLGEGDEAGGETVEHVQVGGVAGVGGEEGADALLVGGNGGGSDEEGSLTRGGPRAGGDGGVEVGCEVEGNGRHGGRWRGRCRLDK